MNIVYGFGGMRSDGDKLAFHPSIPDRWKRYSFPITFRGTKLTVEVGKECAVLRAVSGDAVEIDVYGQSFLVDAAGVKVSLEQVKVG
ncbi:Alpha,alpha-trehalose phosphorylase [compost metagenome]